MSEDLISIPKLIKQLGLAGIKLGQGNPKEHLAYLTKINLIPKSFRRKINGKIVGCYPVWVLDKIEGIESLKAQGMTYSQIRLTLRNKDLTPIESGFTAGEKAPTPTTPFPRPTAYAPTYSPVLTFLIIGLLIGYLLGRNDITKINGPMTSTKEVQSVSSPLVAGEKDVLGTNQGTQEKQPIYVIAVPSENLSRLGKTNIIDLVNSGSN